ncbi:MAG TPA: nitrate reductase [Herpetosiphonaceae bacterium]
MTEATETLVRSQCPYCGVGCGIQLTVRDRQIVRVQGDPRHPANAGKLCIKGATLDQVLDTPNRLLQALHRPARWDDLAPLPLDHALDAAADGLRRMLAEHGPSAVAFYVSGQLTTETTYLINKFCKGLLGTNTIDANSRLCMASAVAGYTLAFGSDGPPCSYADIEAADAFFIWGSNTAECHPIVYRRVEKQVRQHGAKLVVVDPRCTATARYADLHLPIQPGGDTALLNGLLHILIRDGAYDPDFIGQHTEGWEAVVAAAQDWTPEATAQATGLQAEQIEYAAALFAQSERTLSLWSMGVNQSRNGVAKVTGIINLHLATGKIGLPGSGPFSLTGQPNAMGGRETGYLAHQLPGYRQIANPQHRAEIEAFWDLPPGAIDPQPGPPAIEMFQRLADGTIKAIWIIGTNPLASLPHSAMVERALSRADLVIVQEAYATSATLRYADIVLPAAQWAEQDGTFTASDRHVTLLNKAIDPPGEARPDWQLVQAVAHRLGYGDRLAYPDAAAIFDEFRQIAHGDSPLDLRGVSHARLRAGPLQWPCPDDDHPGTPRLYGDGRFATPSGRARFHPASFVPPAEQPDIEHPFWLTTGRVLEQWHTRTRTSQVPKLNHKAAHSYVEIHPVDALALGLGDGDRVTLVGRRGDCTSILRISDQIAPGTLFMPIHWEDANPNRLTNPAIDPRSKQPELKACSVQLLPVAELPTLAPQRERVRVAASDRAGLHGVRAPHKEER